MYSVCMVSLWEYINDQILKLIRTIVLSFNIYFCCISGVITNRLSFLRNVFDASPLGRLTKFAFEDPDIKEEAANCYLFDFLHMMYKPIVKNELKVC